MLFNALFKDYIKKCEIKDEFYVVLSKHLIYTRN
jgi:hypothetical protein